MAAQRVAGLCYMKINGVQYTLRGSAKVDPAQIKRSVIENIDGTISFKEAGKAGTMEMELELTPGVSIQALNSITNSVITFEAANGSVYAMQGGFQTDDLPMDLDEGKVQVKFAGVVIEAVAA